MTNPKPYRYIRHSQAVAYGCDLHNRFKLSYLLKEVQQIAGEQLDKLNLPYEMLYEEGKVFVLAKMGLHVLRMPTGGEELVVLTSPQGTKGAQFLREVLFETPQGERLAQVQTAWLLVDPSTHKILRPEQFGHMLPVVPPQERLTEDYSAQRIKAQGPEVERMVKVVRYSDMDVNRHLNNTVYADLVTDSIPFEVMESREIDRFVINYQSEARLGDHIELVTRQGEDGWYYVTGHKEEKRCFEAMVSFRE